MTFIRFIGASFIMLMGCALALVVLFAAGALLWHFVWVIIESMAWAAGLT